MGLGYLLLGCTVMALMNSVGHVSGWALSSNELHSREECWVGLLDLPGSNAMWVGFVGPFWWPDKACSPARF